MGNAIELLEKQTEKNVFALNKNISIEIMATSPNDDRLKYKTQLNTLSKRITNVLGNIDIYEDKKSCDCIPDHKFPEIRWDENTKSENPDSMTDEEIKSKFQLLTNQRNQQKREVCRQCYQTGMRGVAFGIPYFYKGDENWDVEIPEKGKTAELGCEGCAWYDFAEWRKNLLEVLQK